ncbi:MAG: hypothetical protein Fur0037_13130 [Planctomycetota bacterium]
MVLARYEPARCCPLRPCEIELLQDVVAAAGETPVGLGMAAAVVEQAANLDLFGELLSRYPSPLEDQELGGRRRGLDTLVDALCRANAAGITLRTPTQSIVGRALNLAQINFFRLLWHVCRSLPRDERGLDLRTRSATLLRGSIYGQLVEEVLRDLATDEVLPRRIRERAVRHLAMLWGRRLTWRVHDFLPMLEATWEARARVRVVGGSMAGASEMFQFLTQGADQRFVDLLTASERGEEQEQAFAEFLFGRSSEELEELTRRMAREGIDSLALDVGSDPMHRDAGSVFYEFFETRFLRASARRILGQPGPRYTAEGYVVLAWLQSDEGAP